MTRVLRVPGVHPYVDRCLGDVDDMTGGSPITGPSPVFDPRWITAHHHEFDTVHLHFGFEHLSPAQLHQWLDALAGHRLPLVYTVHDLRNPHQASADPHDRHLDLLIPSAAAVLTLTPGAAAEIRRRWGREAEVVGHPCVIEPAARPARTSPGGLVGMHLKDLRRNVVQPDRVVSAVAAGARAAGGRVRIDLHPGAAGRPELTRTRVLAAAGEIQLSVHSRFTDQELAEYLSGLDVFVLPYRFGTHSGWLEACRDVGTRVVSPSCGHYSGQWDDVRSYRCDEFGGLDEGDLGRVVRQALLDPPPEPAVADHRRLELARVQAFHARLHAGLARRVLAPVRTAS